MVVTVNVLQQSQNGMLNQRDMMNLLEMGFNNNNPLVANNNLDKMCYGFPPSLDPLLMHFRPGPDMFPLFPDSVPPHILAYRNFRYEF